MDIKEKIQTMAQERRNQFNLGQVPGLNAMVGLDIMRNEGVLERSVIKAEVLIEACGTKGPWAFYVAKPTERQRIVYEAIWALAHHMGTKEVQQLMANKNVERVLADLLEGKEMGRARVLATLTKNWSCPRPAHEIKEALVYVAHPYPFLSGLKRLDGHDNVPVQFNCEKDGVVYNAMGNDSYIQAVDKRFAPIWEKGSWKLLHDLPGNKKILDMNEAELLRRLKNIP